MNEVDKKRRKIWKGIQKKNDIKIAEEKKICNIDIFKKEKAEKDNTKMLVEVEKQSVLKKLINYIRGLFQKNNRKSSKS